MLLMIGAYLLTLLLTFLLVSGFVPAEFQIEQGLFLFLPYWMVFIPLAIVAPITFRFYRKLFFVLLLVSSLNALQFFDRYEVNMASPKAKSTSDQLRVLTYNRGGLKDVEFFKNYLEEVDADLMVFQESRRNSFGKALEGYQKIHCEGNFCIASRYPFAVKEKFERPRSKYNEIAATRYEIKLYRPLSYLSSKGKQDPEFSGITLNLYNLHLDTPRSALESILRLDRSTADKIAENYSDRHSESSFVSESARGQDYALIMGDFNMVMKEPLYQTFWSGFKNAFSEQGQGFGYTKYTSWHGVRIDHILCTDDISVQQAWIGPDFGGDHRPVIADLSFPNADLGL